MSTLEVKIFPLVQVDLEGYAKKIAPDLSSTSDSQGDGWTCWFPSGILDNSPGKQIGLVHTGAAHVVTQMEMHPHREEIVFAIREPVVQVLALSTAGQISPDPETVKAFYLNPGEAICVSPGVWHGVGLPYKDPTADYWFILNQPSGSDIEPGWIPFPGNVQLHLIR